MAKYDYGGGCPCGLYSECEPNCIHDPATKILEAELILGERRNIKIKKPIKEYTKKHKEILMEDDDFGFSFSDEIVVETKVIVESTERTEKLRNMIMPLLKNLKKDADKDYIRWAGKDRVKKIDEFIAKMNNIVDGK